MKKYLHLIVFAGIALTLASCGGDDPLPAPEVHFITDPGIVEVGVPVQFENLSLKASSYEWDFGSGDVVTDVSPTVIFQDRGERYVKLTAFTDDNQMVSDSILVNVLERFLTGYFVNNFPTTNGAEAWDPDEEGSAQLADILLQLTPADENNPTGVIDGTWVDWPHGPLGSTYDSNAFGDVVLTNEDWVLILYDYDGDFENFDITQTILMTGTQFNPLEQDVIRDPNSTNGYISVQALDSDNNLLDFDLSFEFKIAKGNRHLRKSFITTIILK